MDFPGGPVANNWCSQFREPRFNPWSGNQIPHAVTRDPATKIKILFAATKTQRSQINKYHFRKSSLQS